jgi:hypothetical protein
MSSGFQYLGGNIVGRAANGLLFLHIINLGGKSKIPNLDHHIFSEEKVAQLQIPMNNLLRVQVLKPLEHLQHEVLDLAFAEPPLLFDQVVKGLNSRRGTLL